MRSCSAVLPAGVTLTMLWPSSVPQVTVRACALRDWPPGPSSWSSPLPRLVHRNLITACEENGAVRPAR